MTYQYTDFLFLSAAAQSDGSLKDAFTRWAAVLPVLPDEALTAHTLSVLRAGRYLSAEGGTADEQTRLSLTDEGKAAVSLPLMKRLFGKTAALHAREDAFCARTVHTAEPNMALGEGAYDALTAHVGSLYETVINPFAVSRTADGLRLTVREPDGGTRDEDGETLHSSERADETADPVGDEPIRPSLAVLCGGEDADEYRKPGFLTVTASDAVNLDGLLGAVSDLILSPQKTRKAALVGTEGGYVLSLSPDADGVRMSAAPIRFNRQRFKGRRDSDLDYAQCGDPVLDCSLSREMIGESLLLMLGACAPLLTDAQREQTSALRRALR